VKRGPSRYVGAGDRPIFIGACPRSGTTLLRTMLNTHPDIAIPRETKFVPILWEHRAEWRGLDSESVRERLARTIAETSWTRADRFATPMDELVKRLVDAPPTLGSMFGTCFQLYAEATGKWRWGDKRPMYARYMDGVFSLFPDAQFINCIRDPRASMASMRKIGWYDGKVAPGLDLWERSVRAVDPWRRVLHADQLIDLRYEDLVGAPESALSTLADYLTLSQDSVPAMLNYQDNVDETSMRYHSRLSEPITTDTVRSWEETLTADEVALVEHVAGPWMDAFGYERTAAGARPSAALLEDYQQRRREVATVRRELEIEEFKRMFICREPVAARLTAAQQRVTGRPDLPPFWKRHLGKPR